MITSYGTGRPTIDAGTGLAILLYNAEWVEVRGLDLRGSGPGSNTDSGVLLLSDADGLDKLEHIVLDDLDITGFRNAGILAVGAGTTQQGYRDLVITGSRIYGNGNGIMITETGWMAPTKSHEQVVISHCEVFDNDGIPNFPDSPSGIGILLRSVQGARIELNHVHDNGSANLHQPEGPLGVILLDTDGGVVQHNIANGNKTGPGTDGHAFSLDSGTTNSVLQYNYSYENEGSGFLAAQHSGSGQNRGNTIRYNVSANDGQHATVPYAGIVVWANDGEVMTDLDIYGNTVFIPEQTDPDSYPVPFRHMGGAVTARLFNNIFHTEAAGGIVSTTAYGNPSITYQGNVYFSATSPLAFFEQEVHFATIAEWRAATGQEMLDGQPVGIQQDPLLTSPNGYERLTDPTRLVDLFAFRLSPGSPAIDSAIDPAVDLGVDPGSQDFYGNSLGLGAGYDVGAHEAAATPPCDDSDGDGAPDCEEECPLDPDKVAPGECGCGVADTDSDRDGTADCNDICPSDPGKVTPGECGCGVADTDVRATRILRTRISTKVVCRMPPTISMRPSHHSVTGSSSTTD